MIRLRGYPGPAPLGCVVVTSAMTAFAALLDRSVAEIAALSADGRWFDRQAVIRIAGVWDNFAIPLVRAARSRPEALREQLAREALARMAEHGPERRDWMAGQPYRPPGPAERHHRDHRGVVRPGFAALDVASLEEDYDLAGAEVRAVRVERAGRELSGHVSLVPPRRYAAGDGCAAAVLELELSGVREVRFDSDDRAGIGLSGDDRGVRVLVGDGGLLRAASAMVWFDDPRWHLSRAGRAADAVTPPRTGRPSPQRPGRQELGDAEEAAYALRRAMLDIRSIRHPHMVGTVPLRWWCEVLANAGTDVAAASGWRMQQLGARWASRTAPAEAHRPEQAQLTFAGYTAAHEGHSTVREASAVVNLAAPDGWRLHSEEIKRTGRLVLHTEAFTAPHAVSGAALRLGDGLLTIIGNET